MSVSVLVAAAKTTAAIISAALVAAACSTGDAQVARQPSLPVPPPAVSGIDHTVTVTWSLADSFDVLPGGLCAGRGDNRGMSDGARIRLHGDTTGFTDETRATARFERVALSAKQALGDDGLYCVLRAVFAPTLPDPDGYSITFPGTRVRWDRMGKPGGTPFGRPNSPPGYGGYNLGSQKCRSLLDPPDKPCPE
jgi:hypothetical protein